MSHSTDIRIYYEHTDAGNVVYYANFLKFAEQGRTEFLRALGFENKSLMDNEGIFFVVRKIEADYLKPAHLDDSLTIKSALESLKNTSFIMKQSVFRHNEILCEMRVTLVCVGAQDIQPARLPDDLRQAFENHISKSE